MDKLSVREARQPAAIGRTVTLQGWIRTRRDSKGGFSFLELNDGSCLGQHPSRRRRQAAELRVGDQASLAPAAASRSAARSSSPAAPEQATEVHAAELTVHGWADPETYPLQKKRHSFE